MASTLKDRLERIRSQSTNFPSNAEIARAVDVKPPSVTAWFNGRTKALGKALLPLARLLGVNPEWLETGRGPMRPAANATEPVYGIAEGSSPYVSSSEIELIDARGSCGGGTIVWDMESLPPLVKEPAWFTRYKVRPRDVFAVFADGDSMADFIVDGDIVIFDRTKVEPRSGAIFLIEHPDGLKIKRLRRAIDGRWYLESLNADKARFPDEVIDSDHAELLRLKGQFVYRQGG